MKVQPAPKLANWLLQLFCSSPEHESMIGDLMERYQQGNGRVWYWRQVIAMVLLELYRALTRQSLPGALPVSPQHVFVVTLLTVALWALLLSELRILGLVGIFAGIILGGFRFLCRRDTSAKWAPSFDAGGLGRIDSSRITIGGGMGAGILILTLFTAVLIDLRDLRLLATPGIAGGLIFAVVLRLRKRLHPHDMGKDWMSIRPR